MEQLNIFITGNWLMLLLWVVLLAMIVQSFIKSNYDKSPQQVVLLMSHEKDSVIVDVREDKEYQTGHIKDSIHIPLGSLASRISEIEKHKNKNVILSCRSGSRSGRACGILKKNGFEQLHNLRGGILAWENENLPVTKG